MDDTNKDAYGEHEKDTPQGRVLHYAHWHIAAYGAHAPKEEVVAQLMVRHGMKSQEAINFLDDMEARGQIELRDVGWWTGVVPNTEAKGPRSGPA